MRNTGHPQCLRHAVKQSLKGKADSDGTVTTHGPTAGIVGEHPPALIFDVADIVKSMQQGAGIEDGDGAIAAVRTAALHHLRLHRGDTAIVLHPHLDGDIGFRTPLVRQESLLAAQLHTHLAASGPREFIEHAYCFKALPSIEKGKGFDGDPLLVRLAWQHKHDVVHEVAGEVILRESPFDPVVDLPVRRLVRMEYEEGKSQSGGKVLRSIPGDWLLPFLHGRYDDMSGDGIEISA